MSIQPRMLVGATTLFAGLWILSGASAAPALSTADYKKAAEADIAQLQKHLGTCVGDAKEAKRYSPTALSLSMMLALYAEGLGDKTLKEESLKVADAISAKNYKGALETAKGLAVKPGAAPLTAADLTKLSKYSLEDSMSPFRVEKVGGLNIEKDIRGIRDGKLTVNPADAEVLATRTAVLLEYACNMPNDKAKTNKTNNDEWVKYCKDSIGICKKIADEAAKGKTADTKEISKQMKALDGKCVDCHNKYRAD